MDDLKNAIVKLRKVSSINQDETETKVEPLTQIVKNNEEFLVVTNTNPTELVNQVFVYEKQVDVSSEIKPEEITSTIQQIDDVLDENLKPILNAETIPNTQPQVETLSAAEPSTEPNLEQIPPPQVSESGPTPNGLDELNNHGAVAAITQTLVENLKLPASELNHPHHHQRKFTVIQPPEKTTPEFFRIKLKHVGTNLN